MCRPGRERAALGPEPSHDEREASVSTNESASGIRPEHTPAAAQAARTSTAGTRAGYDRLEESSLVPAAGAQRVGPADPAQALSVSVRVRRRGNAQLPDSAPAGAGRMSREEFA